MSSLITTADGCYNPGQSSDTTLTTLNTWYGKSMITMWNLQGQSTVYTGALASTDGYKITASMIWRTAVDAVRYSRMGDYGNTYTAGGLSTDVTLGTRAAMGTCVETLTDDGATLPAGIDTQGNYAICHWMYFLAGTNTTSTKPGGRVGLDWGETRYLTEFDWGTAGSNISGTRIETLGTGLGAAQGFALSETTVLTSFVDGGVYSQTWYQPKYAATYAANELRRYNGGPGFGSKIKAYCIGQHALTDTHTGALNGVTPADNSGVGGVVTLSGAFALSAGAIAFGAASLAF